MVSVHDLDLSTRIIIGMIVFILTLQCLKR